MKKSKSKHSQSSLINAHEEELKRGEVVKDTTAKSDHGDKKVGFFENFRRRFGNLGKQNTRTRSQGVMDHIDQVDLLDLAADLGCISAEE